MVSKLPRKAMRLALWMCCGALFELHQPMALGADLMQGAATPMQPPPEAAEPAPVVSSASAPTSGALDRNIEAGKPFGNVMHVTGDVTARAPNIDQPRHLQAGDVVSVGEHLKSSAGSEILIQENDGGLLALRPSSELWVVSFAAEGKSTDHSVLKLLVGAARAVTGWIGHLNRPGVRVVTPTATIGIRGTDHEVYVLTPELADVRPEPLGSYDKVNRGSTTLSAANRDLSINVGQVGFVSAPKPTTRGLMTLLLPVLLDKVPSFYVGGQFDAEIDEYAKNADVTSNSMLRKQLGTSVDAPLACDPAVIGKSWLHAFDSAQEHRNSRAILKLYADDAKIKATVRDSEGGASSVEFDHDLFAQSVKASMTGLKNFHQQRLTVNYAASPDLSSEGCPDVLITSSVSERGEMRGKPYRIQSLESYTVELRNGHWLAIASDTVQQ